MPFSPFPRSPWGNTHTALLGVLLGLALAGAATPALAVPIVYQSQTGVVDAKGWTPALGTTSQSFPISGLGNVNQTALAEAGDPSGPPPDYYMAQGSLQTTLTSTDIQIIGDTTAVVQTLDDPTVSNFGAGADANVTIDFALTTAVVASLNDTWTRTENNGPDVSLTNLDDGFVFENVWGDAVQYQCGTLSQTACDQIVFGDPNGLSLPAGNYELSFTLFAFQPQGSCAIGCNSAGGSASLSVLPEPASDALLGAGLGLVAVVRRRRSPRRSLSLSRGRTRR